MVYVKLVDPSHRSTAVFLHTRPCDPLSALKARFADVTPIRKAPLIVVVFESAEMSGDDNSVVGPSVR
jgi:hypothetical protein